MNVIRWHGNVTPQGVDMDQAEQPIVLVVDDDVDMHRLIEKHLEGLAQIVCESNPEHVMDQAEVLQPSAIILDVSLPGTDGFALLDKLKQNKQTASIPVLFLTVHEDPYQVSRALESGAVDYLAKPIEPLPLQSRIRSIVRRSFEKGQVPQTPRILVVDDDPSIHNLMDFYLNGLGAEIFHASRARDGIQIAQQEKPDLIILDLNMPHMNGFQVCKQLKADAQTAHIPVVFLTADETPFRTARALEIGATDYIVKPVTEIELQARVKSALRFA